MRVAGVMTGTSADGIDLVVCEIHGTPPELDVTQLHHQSGPLPAGVRDIVTRATDQPISAADYARLEHHLSDAIANVAAKAHEKIPFELIGVHGQTLWHRPPPSITPTTLQLLNPYKISQALGIPVVWDFRRADISAGGQGAPLAPFAHFCLFGRGMDPVGVLNLGGIANITILPGDGNLDRIRAWDTGPGMMLVDHLAQTHFDVRFDKDGALAAKGRVHTPLLAQTLEHAYFSQLPPKSCGREEFGVDFAAAYALASRTTRLASEDILRTAIAVTAQSIADAVAEEAIARLIVTGGGSRNRTLLKELQSRAGKLTVSTSDEYGIAAEQVEAIAFALLAYERFHHRPGNLPSVTGALERVVLGSVTG